VPPPFQPDGVTRDRFVPITVRVAAKSGAGRASVKFGYAENGPSESFYCTSRREACIAVDTMAQRTGQIAIANGTVTLQSGDAFDASTWKAGTRIQILGSEWPLLEAPAANSLRIRSQAGPGKVSGIGNIVHFSNPGECVKHPKNSRITANGTTVTVTNPWLCDGGTKGNSVGIAESVNWMPSNWSWDLGNIGLQAYRSTFQYASQAYQAQPCLKGCTIQIPGISQRVLYYQIVYDNGQVEPMVAVAVP